MRTGVMRVWLLVILLCGIALPLSHAGEHPERSPLQQAFEQANWLPGPTVAKLESHAELAVPKGFAAVNAEDAKRIMEGMQNPNTRAVVGAVFPANADWFVLFQWEDIGYVKDDEKGSLDPDAMLESIKKGTATANEERRKRGWAVMNIIGWEMKPRYDETTHNLTWAIQGESEGHPVINYNTRLLGRYGVMRVTLVGSPDEMPTALPQFQTLLSGYSFAKGKRYAEWTQGDKVAAVGLTALVTGGAAAVAAKTGLLKSLWKILAVAGIGALAFAKKLFGRGNKDA